VDEIKNYFGYNLVKKKNERKESEKISDDAQNLQLLCHKTNECQIEKKKYSFLWFSDKIFGNV